MLYVSRPVSEPTDIIPFLGKGEAHWRKGYSAYELAHSWVNAGGIPDSVRAVLDQAAEYRDARLIEGFFERETQLRSKGRPSQTDLLAFIHSPSGYAVLGIEGKVNETLGPLVSEWLAKPTTGKHERLRVLCSTLGLEPDTVGHLRYQLLHRTCAAIYEAQGYAVGRAAMLVHSFSAQHAWFEDFQAFVAALGLKVPSVNGISTTTDLEGISVRLGWVADSPSP